MIWAQPIRLCICGVMASSCAEPSVVAVDVKKEEVMAVGSEAKEMIRAYARLHFRPSEP